MAAMKYLSPEWTAEANKRLREQLTAAEMKFLTSSMLSLYHHCPEGKDRALYFKIENGIFTEISVREPPLPQAEFVISGDYETFAKITRTQLDSRVALLSGKLRLTGNMIKALMLTPIVDRFNKILSAIPCEY
jgi:putative sterol carrier protein